jgi:hypothetical protein
MAFLGKKKKEDKPAEPVARKEPSTYAVNSVTKSARIENSMVQKDRIMERRPLKLDRTQDPFSVLSIKSLLGN